jgi:hypothetical protein
MTIKVSKFSLKMLDLALERVGEWFEVASFTTVVQVGVVLQG